MSSLFLLVTLAFTFIIASFLFDQSSWPTTLYSCSWQITLFSLTRLRCTKPVVYSYIQVHTLLCISLKIRCISGCLLVTLDSHHCTVLGSYLQVIWLCVLLRPIVLFIWFCKYSVIPIKHVNCSNTTEISSIVIGIIVHSTSVIPQSMLKFKTLFSFQFIWVPFGVPQIVSFNLGI